ncbi:MAG: efflux RND transporter periplasmic adaptor subunit [Pseudomonadota bacterium]|nr:MAG: efflux RND transporter periplasmic adaptor subunit [Pseudomonadota bacterium]
MKARTSDSEDLEGLLTRARLESSRRKKWLWAAGVVAALGLVGALFWRGDREPAVRFETVEARRGDLEVTITATGRVQGVNTVEVGAEVSGRIIEVLVEPNSQVRAGQLLARIDPEQFQAARQEALARVRVAEAAALQAEANLEEAEANLARAEAQRKEGLIASQEYDAIRAAAVRARAQMASARAQLQLERANLASATTRLDRTEIRSPIDGMVLSRLVEPGQTVNAGFQTPVLFKVTADLRRMRVHAQVDESDVGKVREGQRARFTVDAWPGRVFEARVEAVRNEPIEEQTVVSYETLLSVDNEEGLLRPGMTATVTIVVDDRKDVLLVPNAALRFRPSVPGSGPRFFMPGLSRPSQRAPAPAMPRGPTVWVEGPEGPRPIPVRILATDGEWTHVEAQGIEPGLPLIVNLAEPSR